MRVYQLMLKLYKLCQEGKGDLPISVRMEPHETMLSEGDGARLQVREAEGIWPERFQIWP